MKLNIKNMYSPHCLTQVKNELTNAGLNYVAVELGSIEFDGNISPDQFEQLNRALSRAGFGLPEYKKMQLVGKIKESIIEYVKSNNGRLNVNFSDHLSETLQYDYTYLANVFSKEVGITIEKFIITNKVYQAMLLIKACELNLTEIAKLLHYSSVGHFSNQFKQVAGISPSAFRKQICEERLQTSAEQSFAQHV